MRKKLLYKTLDDIPPSVLDDIVTLLRCNQIGQAAKQFVGILSAVADKKDYEVFHLEQALFKKAKEETNDDQAKTDRKT